MGGNLDPQMVCGTSPDPRNRMKFDGDSRTEEDHSLPSHSSSRGFLLFDSSLLFVSISAFLSLFQFFSLFLSQLSKVLSLFYSRFSQKQAGGSLENFSLHH